MKYLVVLLVLAVSVLSVFCYKSKQFGFKYTYIIEAQPSVIWNEVQLSLTNSIKSKIWPNKLEVLKSDKFGVGQYVNSTMYIQDKQFNAQFKIIEINDGKSVKFQPVNDNFQGSDTISIETLSSGQLKLVWAGEYSVKSLSIGTLFFKYYYLSKFYDVFYKNINSYWPIIKAEKKVY